HATGSPACCPSPCCPSSPRGCSASMTSRRSDSDRDNLAAPQARRLPSGWADTLKANAPLPLVIAAVALLMPLVDSKGFGAYNARIVMLIGFNIILAVSLQLING